MNPTTPPRVGLIAIGPYDFSGLKKSIQSIPKPCRPWITGLFIPVVFQPAHSKRSHTYASPEDIRSLRKLSHDVGIPITIVRIPEHDATYGSIQKYAFTWAIERDCTIAAVIHAKGNFPLTYLLSMLMPIVDGQASAVVANRIWQRKHALEIRYLFKLQGNRYLCRFLNRIVGHESHDWLCAYRAYSISALKLIPFLDNSNDNVIDLEMLLGIIELRLPYGEVPMFIVPDGTFHLKESVVLGKKALAAVVRYRMHKMGFGTGSTAFNSKAYEIKVEENTSHDNLLQWLDQLPPCHVLDVGCSDGTFGKLLEDMGHTVTGVDIEPFEGIHNRITTFIPVDLEDGLLSHFPTERFDVIIFADVLEHVRFPERLLREGAVLLNPHGRIMVSVPNIGHWYGRIKVGLGLFSYDRRGLFDAGHLRFFTRITFRRMADAAQLQIVRGGATSTPLSNVISRGTSGKHISILSHVLTPISWTVTKVNTLGAQLWPTLFGYQLLFELRIPTKGNPHGVRFIDLSDSTQEQHPLLLSKAQ